MKRLTLACPVALLLALSLLGCGGDAPGGSTPNNEPTPNNAACANPSPEVCDGIDNDCDGAVDDGFNLVGDVAHCGACGVACAFDEGRASCRGGQCALIGCLPGFFDADNDPLNGCESTACELQGEEVCNGADDDCDGDFDEGFGVGETPERCGGCDSACALPSAEASCQDGVCGVAACQEGFEDEDGDAANGCEAVACAVDPGGEVCDGLDNDCDGIIDNGFDLLSDPLHCGDCDTACALDGATPACDAGRCAIEGCLSDRFDLDQQADNGCEYLCEAATRAAQEIPCDGQDNDCNGVIDDDPRLGAACALGPALDGLLVCLDGGLICAAAPSPTTDICGEISGLLPLEGSPYIITCEEVAVPDGARLVVAEGVEVRSGPLGGLTPRVRIQGRMRSLGARWSGLSLVVEGNVALEGDALSSAGSIEPLIEVTSEGARLDAEGVTLTGQGQAGVGLLLGGEATNGLTWRGGRAESLDVGVAVERGGDITFEAIELVDNTTAISINTGAAVVLEGGALRNTEGIQARGIVVGAEQDAARLTLRGLELEQRDDDGAITIDPDRIAQVEGDAIHVGEGRSTVHLSGDLGSTANLTPIGQLDGFTILGEVVVRAGAELVAASPVALRGQADSLLRIEGGASLAGISIDDLAIRVEVGGALDIDNARVSVGATAPQRGCLIEVAGAFNAHGAQIASPTPLPLDGICAEGVTPALGGALIAGFARGLVIRGGGPEAVIEGVRFNDNGIGLSFEGAQAPEIRDNTFASLTDRQTVAIKMQVGARPGGVIAGNTFDLDRGDTAYHLDPDNLSNADGTTFGPNTWSRHQPDGYLISGALEGSATIKTVTELLPEDSFFITVQVLGSLIVPAGGRLDVRPQGQIVTLEGIEVGLTPTLLEVEGHLKIDGPGVLVNNLPISFLPGSTGEVSRADLSGARRDLPLVRIEDAEPTIGGVGRASAVRLTGSNLRDMVGVEIRSTSAMCQGPGTLCPFIASNDFRNLGVGIALISPASFSGVNDFDDANPNGDTVPINVDRR